MAQELCSVMIHKGIIVGKQENSAGPWDSLRGCSEALESTAHF